MPLTLNGTTGIAGVDGTAGTPAAQGSDTNTGIFYGTDTVSISTGGTARVVVNSDGQTVLGAGTASLPAMSTTGDLNTGTFYPAADTIGWTTGGSERARIDSSGNLLVGTTSSASGAKLSVIGAGVYTNSGYALTTDSSYFTPSGSSSIPNYGIGCPANSTVALSGYDHLRFYTAQLERARIDSSGNLLVGYTSSNGAYKLQVNSQIFATSATIATSDARYKENVAPIADGLTIVNALNPVSFDWKHHPIHAFDTEHKTVGFLAQEVQAAMADKPYVNSIIKESECELPDGTKEKFLGIAEGNMVSILTKAIQELSAKLDAAEARIAALEAK